MLNKDEALTAIQYFYKDVEELEVGNPLPFVKTINPTNMDAFNELMVDGDGNVKHIFYGQLSWNIQNPIAAPIDCFIDVIQYINNLTNSTEIHPLYLDQILDPNTFNQGTTKGLFLHNIQGEHYTVSLDGYLFAVTKRNS